MKQIGTDIWQIIWREQLKKEYQKFYNTTKRMLGPGKTRGTIQRAFNVGTA
jgi:hypothetical protein